MAVLPPRRRVSRPLLIALIATWTLVGGGGLAVSALHGAQGTAVGASPPLWPSASRLERVAERPTLLIFAHPRCPCTRATIRELERLLARTGNAFEVRLALFHPTGTPASWSSGALWDDAASIPGVTVVGDEGGAEARRFDATSSGTVLLYDRSGVLRFRGGITPARGHEGDSAGAESIVRWVHGGQADPRSMVFGCPIWNEQGLETKWRLSWRQ